MAKKSPAKKKSTTKTASAYARQFASSGGKPHEAPAEQPTAEQAGADPTAEQPPADQPTEPTTVPAEPRQDAAATGDQGSAEQAPETTEKAPAKIKKQKTPKPPKEKKLSAIDAAAQVLAEAGQPMTCQEMILAMAEKGLWTSPGGQTPAATLYSAILREIGKKAEASRFSKSDRGKFTRATTQG
jgi:hypothetical protein